MTELNQLAYTVEQAARLCGVSENTMRAMIRAGEIHAARFKSGDTRGELRVGRVEIERFLLGIPRPEGC